MNDSVISNQIEILAKYSGYIIRQQDEINKQKAQFDKKIPKEINYDEIHGLSNEAKEKLKESRPETIDQATRITGVTSATISILLVYLKSKHRKLESKAAEQVVDLQEIKGRNRKIYRRIINNKLLIYNRFIDKMEQSI